MECSGPLIWYLPHNGPQILNIFITYGQSERVFAYFECLNIFTHHRYNVKMEYIGPLPPVSFLIQRQNFENF